MNTNTTTRKANYIINMTKSISKDLAYALDIICWYSMTEQEDEEIKKIILTNWNK